MKRPSRRLGLFVVLLCVSRASLAARTTEFKPLIQIAVEVVEIDEVKTQRLGVRWTDLIEATEIDVPAVFKLGDFTRTQVFGSIQALLDEGAADLLANPKLVTRDGTTASFRAGGELPYAVAGTLGTANIEFKTYGVQMQISPVLEQDDRISMAIEAEVSAPDEQNSVSLAGNMVPGVLSRRVSSQITLAAGATITLAGLIQNQKINKRVGIPILGQIPILRYAFSHKVTTNRKTSIVVFVTPSILEAPGDRKAVVRSPQGLRSRKYSAPRKRSAPATPLLPPLPDSEDVAEKLAEPHDILF